MIESGYAQNLAGSSATQTNSNQQGYQPQVSITTQFFSYLRSHEIKAAGQVCEIKITYNGSGIPVHIKDKIFQPFFTTKPTGQGTGIGLSLAYDNITKGHGGMIDMESEENIGSKLIIRLPLPSE